MNFDRCTGVLSLSLSLTLPYDSVTQLGIGGSGIAFSASGRFLYANTFRKVYQFDLEDANVQTSCTFVGEEDTVMQTGIDREQLAPNNKIYIANFNGFPAGLSVIDSPEVKGVGCNFLYHTVILNGGVTQTSVPNMINYHLGKLAGSDCDTITAIEKLTASKERYVVVYPNPAHDYVNVVVDEGMIGGSLVVTDVTGRLVFQSLVTRPSSLVPCSSWSKGVYFVTVKTKEGEWKEKLVIH
ncbi:MAG: T9SS type A sorting domain-containing protein [Bacteroidetes bacterium]|nr:T9SS type A sorting domain-containing protein [Bacteroidota bacterium]